MQLKYSPHAKKRLRQRKISKILVLKTLANPDKKVLSYRNRFIVNKKFKSYTLEIVYVIEDGQIEVITLYRL